MYSYLMTGPPYLSGKAVPTRAGQPVPENTATTVYQLSLAAVLPWLETGGDRTPKKSNTLTSNVGGGISGGKFSGGSVRSQSGSVQLPSEGTNSTHDSKLHSLAANSPSTHTNGTIINSNSNNSSNTNNSSSTGTRSKVYNIQLPVLYSGRSSRPYGSFSSGSGGGGSVGGNLTIVSTGNEHAPSMPVPLPPQSSLHLSSQGSQLVVRGRGLTRTPIEDTQPIDSIKDIDILTKPYGHNLQTALDSQLDTPCSSGRSSPTITVTQSPLSMSRGGWTTGNTTEISSLDSSYSMDDFDKLATNTVSQHFEEINSVLFEDQRETLTPRADVTRECQEWSSQFPHLRVLGKQVCPAKDTGYYHLPSPYGSRPVSSSASRDFTDSVNSSTDSQGLTLTGRSVSAVHAPIVSLSGTNSSSSSYSSFVEEVIEEDGVYEDVIAVDYKNIYEDNMENKKQITPRRRRIGYPPITPNACVKDSVMSGVFDHVWQEIMSWMRELLKKYTSEISDSRNEIVSYSPTNNIPSTLISREVSLIMQNSRQYSFQRSNTHMGSSTEKSINELLHITSMPLKNRPHGHQLMDPSESHVLGSSTHSGSSFQSLSRPASHLRPSQRGTRIGRLAPIAKTSSFDEERASHPATEALRVKGRNPMTNDPMPSPHSNFQRNGSLPPLEMERTQVIQYRKLHQGNRAASAIDNKDMRLSSFRDKAHFVTDQARPNTTNAMRSDAPFIASNNPQSRRSSTALGNTYSLATRNSLLLNRSLDIRGNSLQPGNDTIHNHPDIQEDLQESTGEDIYHTHWNAPQPNHSMYRRSRVTLR